MSYKTRINSLISFNRIRDIGYLGLLQISNQIIPLIAIPLITTNIGVESYGKIAVSLAIIYGEKVLIDFGFDLFGVAWIGRYGNSKHRLNKFVNNTIYLKLLVWFSFVLIGLFLQVFSFFRNEIFYLVLVGQVWQLGEVFFLKFFYQATNRIRLITLFAVCSKLIMLLCLSMMFSFCGSIYSYFIALGIGSISSGALAIYYLLRKNIIVFEYPSRRFMIYLLLKNRGLLLGKSITYAYAHSITFVVQFILGFTFSGYLAICQKLIGGASSLILPVVEVLFPYISEKYNELTKQSFADLFSKSLRIVIGLSLVPIFVIILFPKTILSIFIPENLPVQVIVLFRLLSITIISSQIGTLFTQLITIAGRIRLYLSNVLVTLIFTLFFTIILGLSYGILGIGAGVIIGQTVHIIFYRVQLKKLL